MSVSVSVRVSSVSVSVGESGHREERKREGSTDLFDFFHSGVCAWSGVDLRRQRRNRREVERRSLHDDLSLLGGVLKEEVSDHSLYSVGLFGLWEENQFTKKKKKLLYLRRVLEHVVA